MASLHRHAVESCAQYAAKHDRIFSRKHLPRTGTAQILRVMQPCAMFDTAIA